MASVVDYPARDMTITVQAGMTFRNLTQILSSENQQLPIDVPDDEATIGAIVASDFSGPRRYGYGTLRDYLIGMEAVDGQGRVFHAGGRVVKNVAGYDLCRLMIGSRGRLGVLTQLTFKLKPRPASQRLLVACLPSAAAAETALTQLNLSAARPVVLDILNRTAAESLLGHLTVSDRGAGLPDGAMFLVLAVEGSSTVCQWQLDVLADELRGLSGGIADDRDRQTDAHADAAVGWYQQVAAAQHAATSDSWLLRLTTVPSRVTSAISLLADTNYLVLGRAGNGVLYIRPSYSDPGRNSTAEDGENCLQRLSSVVADGIGSLDLLKWSGTAAIPPLRHTNVSDENRHLAAALQQMFDPGHVLAVGG